MYSFEIILTKHITDLYILNYRKEAAPVKQLSKKEQKKKDDEELAALLGGMGVDDKKSGDK